MSGETQETLSPLANPSCPYSLLLTSIFSAGNTYCYCSIRTLYGLALEGRAPRFLTYTTRKGVPIYCFLVVMIFPMLSFLQTGNSSAIVITWFASLVTAGGTFFDIYLHFESSIANS